MIEITEKLTSPTSTAITLTLPFELRQKSRLRATLDDGTEVGLFLERGTILRDGDVLRAANGTLVGVRAAPEPVSVATTDDARLFARACYHLGNRHVPLQIEAGELRYLHDHVLDDMLRGLGVAVTFATLPFEPEAGAYPTHAHGGHGHTHSPHGHHDH